MRQAIITTAVALGQMVGPVLGSVLHDIYTGFGPALVSKWVAVLALTILLASSSYKPLVTKRTPFHPDASN